jgi:DNA-binding LytR/AlgR family response regulator
MDNNHIKLKAEDVTIINQAVGILRWCAAKTAGTHQDEVEILFNIGGKVITHSEFESMLIERTDREIEFTNNDGTHRYKLSEICYITSSRNDIYVRLVSDPEDGLHKFRGPLKDVMGQLNSEYFVQICQFAIVNIHHVIFIKERGKGEIKMVTGTTFPISRNVGMEAIQLIKNVFPHGNNAVCPKNVSFVPEFGLVSFICLSLRHHLVNIYTNGRYF